MTVPCTLPTTRGDVGPHVTFNSETSNRTTILLHRPRPVSSGSPFHGELAFAGAGLWGFYPTIGRTTPTSLKTTLFPIQPMTAEQTAQMFEGDIHASISHAAAIRVEL